MPLDATPGPRTRSLTLFLAILVLHAEPVMAADWYVDVARGNDGNDGLSWATAKKSVAEALVVAASSAGPDTVSVARGRYVGALTIPPETTLLGGFPTGGGSRDARRHPTIIDGHGAGPAVSLGPGTDASMISGLRIEGGRSLVPTEGGGVTLRGTAARVENCVVERCRAPSGAGILIDARGMAMLPMIERCVIRANVASAAGPAADGFAGGILVLTDDDAPLDMPIVHTSFIEGNVVEPSGGAEAVAGGIYVRGRARIEHAHVRGNLPTGVVFDGNAAAAPAGMIINSEISGSPSDGLIVRCGATSFVVDNCTFVAHGGAAIVGRPLRGSAGGSWQAEVRRSILWRNGIRGLASAPGCELRDAIVADSVVEGGHAGGANVIDADPLLVQGPAMDYYLASRATGGPVDSVALDAGPALAQDLGLSAFTTQLDSALDTGRVDWGAHCEPETEGIIVARGTIPSALVPYAQTDFLPFDDFNATPPVLYYDAQWTMNAIRVRKMGDASMIEIGY